MPHHLDGYELKFAARRSWKAERRLDGTLIDTVPVTWTKGIRETGNDRFLQVWFPNTDELRDYSQRTDPFVVAVATAKDFNQHPHQFSKFNYLYEVVATGELLSPDSIETRIIRRIGKTVDGAPGLSKKVTRISFNTADWRRPTGEAAEQEGAGTYNRQYGFGHEDWLFRDEWQIAGWRYAFLQGVNKSLAKLLKAGEPFDVTLFTVQRDKRRRYVASIGEIECLTDAQAEAALAEFQKRGWLASMKQEIVDAGGDPSALGNTDWAKHILNVRFRLDNVSYCEKATFADSQDPIMHLHRYLLYDFFPPPQLKGGEQRKTRAGTDQAPGVESYFRSGGGTTEVSPEHAKMQKKLMKELNAEFSDARVERERHYIDVLVETKSELYLYEIKSDLSPRTAMRKAIGQLLEYAYYFPDRGQRQLRLIIVGRNPLSADGEAYLRHLQSQFALPLTYRVVAL